MTARRRGRGFDRQWTKDWIRTGSPSTQAASPAGPAHRRFPVVDSGPNVFTPICSKCHIGAGRRRNARRGPCQSAAAHSTPLGRRASAEQPALMRVFETRRSGKQLHGARFEERTDRRHHRWQMPLMETPLPQATIERIRPRGHGNGAPRTRPRLGQAQGVRRANTAPTDKGHREGSAGADPCHSPPPFKQRRRRCSLVKQNTDVTLERWIPRAAADATTMPAVARLAPRNPAVCRLTPRQSAPTRSFRLSRDGCADGGARSGQYELRDPRADTSFEFTVGARFKCQPTLSMLIPRSMFVRALLAAFGARAAETGSRRSNGFQMRAMLTSTTGGGLRPTSPRHLFETVCRHSTWIPARQLEGSARRYSRGRRRLAIRASLDAGAAPRTPSTQVRRSNRTRPMRSGSHSHLGCFVCPTSKWDPGALSTGKVSTVWSARHGLVGIKAGPMYLAFGAAASEPTAFIMTTHRRINLPTPGLGGGMWMERGPLGTAQFALRTALGGAVLPAMGNEKRTIDLRWNSVVAASGVSKAK